VKRAEKLFYGLVIGSALFANAASGAEQPNKELTDRVSQLEEQMKTKSLPEKIGKKIKFSGAIEAQASYEHLQSGDPSADGQDSSNMSLSKAKLGVDVDIDRYVSGRVLFLWEEDDNEPVTVDEGYILLGGKDDMPAWLKAGKIYVPFGNFKSNMISDSLPRVAGETRKSAIVGGIDHESGLNAAVYAFNGDLDVDEDDDNIRNFGAKIGYTIQKEDLTIDAGASYIDNLFGSKGLKDATDRETEAALRKGFSVKLHDKVPGMSIHTAVKIAGFSFLGEYMTMLDDPEVDLEDIVPGTLSGMGLGSRSGSDSMEAWNVELGYTLEVAGKELTIGAAYQGITNAEDWFPETRIMGATSLGIFKDTTLAVEYRHDEFETDDKADVLTSQLAIGF